MMAASGYPREPGHRGIDTSIEAARSIDLAAGRLQRIALKAIRAAGGRGLTTNELVAVVNIHRDSIQPRTSELRERGLTRRPFPLDTDVYDPAKWNPINSSGALIEAQRIDPFSGDRICIGGQAILTAVNAAGIMHGVVKAWHDRTGRPIDLDAPEPTSLLSRIRHRILSVSPPPATRCRITEQRAA